MGFQLRADGKYLHKVNHLLYMDDLKLYGRDKKELRSLLNITHQFSSDIEMKFGVEKCAMINVINGKLQDSQMNDFLLQHLHIPSLGIGEKYKYLGFLQTLKTDSKLSKEHLKTTLSLRVGKLLKTELNAKNKFQSINSWAIPALSYSFGVIKWSRTALEGLNRKIRTTLTAHRVHHPKSATERLYLPRKEGGRGLLDLVQLHNRQIRSLKKYFILKADSSSLYKAIVLSDLSYTPLNLSVLENVPPITSVSERQQTWTSKSLHGRFPRSIENADKYASLQWLRDGFLFGETEGFITAIQDQVIATKNYKKAIEGLEMNDLCRACNRVYETISHIITGCSTLANTEYLRRHNLTANIVHQAIALKYQLITTEQPYYKYNPPPVLEGNSIRLYFDHSILTDKKIPANRPDIVIHDLQKKMAWFIDIAHPADHNINKSEQEKITKYLPLSEEYRKIHKLQYIEILPLIVSANGLVNKNLSSNISKLKLNNNFIVSKIQRSTILETCRIVRKFLNIPAQSLL